MIVVILAMAFLSCGFVQCGQDCLVLSYTGQGGRMTLEVRQCSSSITLYRTDNSDDRVSVALKSLTELDANGREIRRVLGEEFPRSFDNFTDVYFDFTGPFQLYDAEGRDFAQFFYMNATLKAGNFEANLWFQFYIIVADYLIDIAFYNTKIHVIDTDTLVTFYVNSWSFCDSNAPDCYDGNTDQVGSYLDIEFDIQGTAAATEHPRNPDLYQLGDEAYLFFMDQGLLGFFNEWPFNTDMTVPVSNGHMQFLNNGTYEDNPMPMPDGYPRLETDEQGHQSVAVRLSAFPYWSYCQFVISKSGEKTMSVGTVTVRMFSNAGTVEIQQDDGGHYLALTIERLQEVTEDGRNIQLHDHVIQTLSLHKYVFSDVIDEKYQNKRVKKVSLSTNFTDMGILTIHARLFLEEGTVSENTGIYRVVPGTVKLDIEIAGWLFCGDNGSMCSDNTGSGIVKGEYVDVDVLLTGNVDEIVRKYPETSEVTEYDLGPGSIAMPTQFVLPRSTSMKNADIYPNLVTDGDQSYFRFRFPRTNGSLNYDGIFILLPPQTTNNTWTTGNAGTSANSETTENTTTTAKAWSTGNMTTTSKAWITDNTWTTGNPGTTENAEITESVPGGTRNTWTSAVAWTTDKTWTTGNPGTTENAETTESVPGGTRNTWTSAVTSTTGNTGTTTKPELPGTGTAFPIAITTDVWDVLKMSTHVEADVPFTITYQDSRDAETSWAPENAGTTDSAENTRNPGNTANAGNTRNVVNVIGTLFASVSLFKCILSM